MGMPGKGEVTPRTRRYSVRKLAEFAIKHLFPGSTYVGCDKRRGKPEVTIELPPGEQIIDTPETTR